LVIMLAIAALLFVAQVPDEISVRVVADDDPCDLESRIPAALAQTLRGVGVVRDAGARSGRLSLSVTSSRDRVRFDLADETGRVVLAREVANQADACAATADSVAVIVERYLRDLGYEPPPLPDTPVRTATTAVAVPTSSIAGVTTSTRPTESSPSDFSVEIGLSVDVGELSVEQTHLRAGGLVVFRMGWGPFEGLLMAGGRFGENVRAESNGSPQLAARINVFDAPLLAGVGACAPVLGRLCLDVLGGAEAWYGWLTHVHVVQTPPGGASLVTPAVVVSPRLDVAVSERFLLSIAANGWFRISPPTFALTGGSPTYMPPEFGLTIAIGGRMRFF
jgi:hypothetical protein